MRSRRKKCEGGIQAPVQSFPHPMNRTTDPRKEMMPMVRNQTYNNPNYEPQQQQGQYDMNYARDPRAAGHYPMSRDREILCDYVENVGLSPNEMNRIPDEITKSRSGMKTEHNRAARNTVNYPVNGNKRMQHNGMKRPMHENTNAQLAPVPNQIVGMCGDNAASTDPPRPSQEMAMPGRPESCPDGAAYYQNYMENSNYHEKEMTFPPTHQNQQSRTSRSQLTPPKTKTMKFIEDFTEWFSCGTVQCTSKNRNEVFNETMPEPALANEYLYRTRSINPNTRIHSGIYPNTVEARYDMGHDSSPPTRPIGHDQQRNGNDRMQQIDPQRPPLQHNFDAATRAAYLRTKRRQGDASPVTYDGTVGGDQTLLSGYTGYYSAPTKLQSAPEMTTTIHKEQKARRPNNVEEQQQQPICVEVLIPPGGHGFQLCDTENSDPNQRMGPLVYDVKENYCNNNLRIGDRIVGVDGIDTKQMTAAEVKKILNKRKKKPRMLCVYSS